MNRRLFGVLSIVTALATGCTFPAAGADPGPTPKPSKPTTASPSAKTISTALGRVKVVAARPKVAGYQRDRFGGAWSDSHDGLGGHNGCDTRNDVLAAQLKNLKYRGKSQCVVIAGTLVADPYTGKTIEFRKAKATEVQIDHIYPLSRAWDMGASKWPQQRRVDFANDEADNLLAVGGSANMSKGDSGPGEWLPINRKYSCTYVLRYLQAARKWSLPITAADRDSVKAINRTC
ncbi:HNH endonuclease [Kribbella antibiotica]|uniref:HNH endonuclease n=1 Tax=Kribbella antibiotica TaxID=190195 RepID=A0A4R4YWY8_9ACTN|nr:HNH endonuclease family protein [Kribbella antibiotica]TDD49981.1 HNH endonuclease [Kribbella antibiotica]